MFEQLGQAEFSLTGHSIDSLSGSANLLLPLIDQPKELLFTQWGLHRKQRDNTGNIGIGYRWFTESQGYWGSNLFYDSQLHSPYHRWGLGVERCYRNAKIAVNGYFPKKGSLMILDKVTAYAQPAFGTDLRCQYQIPKRPHWRVNLQGECYWGDIIVSKGETVENPTAMTLGVDYTPIPLITAGYDFRYDSAQKKSHQFHLQFSYLLGIPLSHQLNPEQVAANRLLNPERLALVQRNNQIVLKKVVPKTIVPKQKSNAGYKLELPSELVGAPGTTHTIYFKLKTPCSHDEWSLTSFSNIFWCHGAVHIVGKNRIEITLPWFSGHYTLQLKATNQQGIRVTSNWMSIHVKDNPSWAKQPERGPRKEGSKPTEWALWQESSHPDKLMRSIFRDQKEIQELESACKVFNVPCDSTTLKDTRQITLLHREFLLELHPDKGKTKDHEASAVLNNAKDILFRSADKYQQSAGYRP